MDRRRDGAGQNAGFADPGVVLLTIGRREFISAVRAAGIAGGDDRMARRAFLGRCRPLTCFAILNAKLVDRSVAFDIAPEIQHQAVLLTRVQPKSSADHLVIQARRQGRPQQDDAVDVVGVETRRQDVDVARVAQIAGPEPIQQAFSFLIRRCPLTNPQSMP